MGKMIATISDLERKNHELNMHLKNYENKGPAVAANSGTTFKYNTGCFFWLFGRKKLQKCLSVAF